MRGLRRGVAVVLALAAFASSALMVGATGAGATQANPEPLPLSPPVETSNPSLENDRANFHKYLNEADAELLALIRGQGTNSAPRCSESVKAEIVKLTETLVTTIHPNIVTLKAELAADGSLNPSLLKEVGAELEASSTVLQRVRKRAGPCMKMMAEPGSSATTAPAPGSERPIIEHLQDIWKPLPNFYDNAFANIHKLIVEYQSLRLIEIQQKLIRRFNKLPTVHKELETLEKELAEHGEVSGPHIKETKAGMEWLYQGLLIAEREVAGREEPESEGELREAEEGKCPGSSCSE